MSDLTVYAEALIGAVARAFYDDECVMLVDILIAQKFLRDDDMGQRLSLPSKKLRASLQFLQEEHLVRSEMVDDLAQGGSQATRFYYLDYNRAIHSIRLRIYLLRKKLEEDEMRARSNSFYLCPGYKQRRCNGRYTEEEAQHVLDPNSGLFLCQECSKIFENDPNPPPIKTYTLQLVDNTKDLRLAMDNLRRVNVQLSAKFISNVQLRSGIYDLLQKVRVGKKVQPITSNLPSENFALGIGSKRLAGTGRTAGIKAKKLEQQGVVVSAAQAKKYLVGDGTNRHDDDTDLLFLKNALGHEIQFTVERGGGARAQLLASKRRVRTRKLMDAAASRVGASLPLHMIVERKRKAKEEAEAAKATEENGEKSKHGRKLMKAGDTLEFLKDNIGLKSMQRKQHMNGLNGGNNIMKNGKHQHIDIDTMIEANEEDQQEENAALPEQQQQLQQQPEIFVLADDVEELRNLSDETRMATFQTQYKLEMDRQTTILELPESSPRHNSSSAFIMSDDNDDDDNIIYWEDGDDDNDLTLN